MNIVNKWVLGAGLLLVIALLLILPGMMKQHAKAESFTGKTVYCTTYPVDLFTRAVAEGAKGIRVRLLLPPETGCPHDCALTPENLMELSKPDVILLKNGLELDDHLCDAAKAVNKSIRVYDLSEGGKFLKSESAEDNDEHEHGHEAEHEDHHHHEHGEYNPHLFASPDTALTLVRNAEKTLVSLDPENTALYRKNADALCSELEKLSEDFRSAGLQGKKIAVQHDVFAYLARLCGMDEAVSLRAEEGQALSPAEVAELTREIREKGVGVLFTEPQYPGESANLIAKEAGITAVTLDPVATGPENPSAGVYIKAMRNNLSLLRKTLIQQ